MRSATTIRYFCRLRYLWIVLAMPLAAGTSRIYVANIAGTTVDVIDPTTNKVVDAIHGIEAPEGVHFSPDGSRVYITYGAENFLDVVDRKTGKIIKKVPISGRANDLAVTNDGRRILICIAETPGALDIIDTDSLEKIKSIPFNNGLHDIELTADGKYAVAGSVGGKFAAFFDVEKERLDGQMNFDQGVQTFAIESGPDGSGRRIFISPTNTHGFKVVDFAKRAEVATIMLPDEPSGFTYTGITSHGIRLAPNGKTLWVNSRRANSVFVYSLPDLKLLGRVPMPEIKRPGKLPIGGGPYWITFTPDSKTVYIPNHALNLVVAIDVKTIKEVTRIPVGQSPERISTLVLP
jgi:YVTN family beta-propeller protein